jgi:hypothetical protein
MKCVRNAKRAALLMSGLLWQSFGGCLPENYLALSARNVSVAIADSLLGLAVNPFLASLQTTLDETAPMGTTGADDSADTGG